MDYPYYKSVMHLMLMDIRNHILSCNKKKIRLLNLGCGQTLFLENFMLEAIISTDITLCIDRVDIDLKRMDHPLVEDQYESSVEDMSMVPSSKYDISVANWLMEHVLNIDDAVCEISRTLVPGGLFFATIPNPASFEFSISKYTPFILHKLIRKECIFPTYYSYGTIYNLLNMFHAADCSQIKSICYPAFETYLFRLPVISHFSRVLDNIYLKWIDKKYFGHYCIVMEKKQTGLNHVLCKE